MQKTGGVLYVESFLTKVWYWRYSGISVLAFSRRPFLITANAAPAAPKFFWIPAHIMSNWLKSIYGTEYKDFPKVDVPLICDMSSDILSREIDFNQFDMIWAGIQKNLGADEKVIRIGTDIVGVRDIGVISVLGCIGIVRFTEESGRVSCLVRPDAGIGIGASCVKK